MEDEKPEPEAEQAPTEEAKDEIKTQKKKVIKKVKKVEKDVPSEKVLVQHE